MEERFTDRARNVMKLANQEAIRFNHEYIGTEHILLGLIAEGSGVAAIILKNRGIDLNSVRREVEAIVQSGPDRGDEDLKLPKTPRAKRVLEFAIAEAKILQHNYVGTEHLLLGLIREGEGLAAQVLMNLGLSADVIRKEVLELLGVKAPHPESLHELHSADEPSRLARAVQELQDVLDAYQNMRKEAIANQDFERVAALRVQQDKLDEVMKVLRGVRHHEPTFIEEVTADLTVTSPKAAPASTSDFYRRTNQFEIHIPPVSPSGELGESEILNAFHEQLVERFGRVFSFQVPHAALYQLHQDAQAGEAIHWSFFADDKPDAIAFLREFREELQKALGLDKIVILCRKVTIL